MQNSTKSIHGFSFLSKAGILKLFSFLFLIFLSFQSDAQSNGFTTSFNLNNQKFDRNLASGEMGDVAYWSNDWNSDIVDKNLRIKFDQNQYGTNCGVVSKINMNGDNTYSVEYRLKFDNGFDFALGGKIPGLAGGSAPSGGGQPTDGKGFSTRFMWRSGGKLVVYAYYRDQVSYYGDDWETGITMNTGQWYTIKEQVTVNTGNNYNGTVTVWVNGAEVLKREGLRLMTVNNTVDVMYMDCFMGGNDASWSPNHTQYLRMDDFVCTKGGGSASAPPSAGNDAISSISAPNTVTQGTTVTATVNYEASTNRDIVVSFKEDNGNYTKYGNDIRTSVAAGSGSIDVSVPILSSVPVANDQYQFQVYMTTTGGGYNDQQSIAFKTDVDVVAPVSTYDDIIISTTTPSSVTPGQEVSIPVEYESSTDRDIQVVFQLNESPWTYYGSKTVSVSAGRDNINVSFTIDSNTPIANDSYQFQTFITEVGAGWGVMKSNLNKDNIDCVQAQNDDNNGTYFYIKNKATNRHIRPDHGGDTAWLRVDDNDNSDWFKWEKVTSGAGYFYLKNKQTGMYFRPTGSADGARIEQKATSFTGHWTQWKEVPKDDGSIHLENRATGKFIRPSNNTTNTNLELRPNTWTGDWTRWYFESAGSRKGMEEAQQVQAVSVNAYQSAENTLSISGHDFTYVQLFDLSGQLKWESNNNSNIYNINIAGYEKGVYVIKSITETGLVGTQKLILK